MKYLYISFFIFICNSAISQQLVKLYPDILYNNIANKIVFESKYNKLTQLKAYDLNGKKINIKYSISDSNTVTISPINLNKNITIQFLSKKEILLSKNFNVIELPAPSLYFNVIKNHVTENEDYFIANKFLLLDSLISFGTTNIIEFYMNSNILDVIKPNVTYYFLPNNIYKCQIYKWNNEYETISETIFVPNLMNGSKIDFSQLKKYFTDNVYAISIIFHEAKYLAQYENGVKKEYNYKDNFEIQVCKNQQALTFVIKGIIVD